MAGASLGERADVRRPSRGDREAVLCELSDALARGVRTCVLEGPLGIGKTALLRALAARERLRRPVLFSPFLHFPPDEAVSWLCRIAGTPFLADDPGSFAAALGGRPEAPALLLVDEAQAAPAATLAKLGRLVRDAEGSVQLVGAGIEGPALARVVAVLPERPLRLRLDAPVTAQQVRALLARAMDEPGLGEEARAALRACDAESVVEAAGGVPRRVENVIVARAFAAEARAWRERAARASAARASAAAEEPEPLPAPPGREPARHADGRPAPALPDADAPSRLRAPAPGAEARRALARLRAAAGAAGARARRHVRAGRALVARTGGAAGSLASRAGHGVAGRARAAAGALELGRRRLREGIPRIAASVGAVARSGTRRVLCGLARLSEGAREAVRRGARAGGSALERGRAVVRASLHELSARAARGSRWMGERPAAARAALAPRARALFQPLRDPRIRPRRLVPGGLVLLLLGAGLVGTLLQGPEPGSEPPPPVSAAPVEAEAQEAGAVSAGEAPEPRSDSLPPVSAAPIEAEAPDSGAASAAEAPPPSPGTAEGPPVTVHVNATPWARIRLDGRELGATPLTAEEVRPGPHEIEAEFPDGRVERRVVEIGPDSRRVVFR